LDEPTRWHGAGHRVVEEPCANGHRLDFTEIGAGIIHPRKEALWPPTPPPPGYRMGPR
jgi:hypothetical protein